ncbi:MAG: hypothetical protein AAF404_22580, partial [Pseudomonadota bacterium]
PRGRGTRTTRRGGGQRDLFIVSPCKATYQGDYTSSHPTVSQRIECARRSRLLHLGFDTHQLNKLPVKPATTNTLLIVVLGFVGGYSLGQINLESVVRHTRDAYINRHLSMSGAERQQVTYYLYSNSPEVALAAVNAIPGVLSTANAGPAKLYDVVIDYSQRRKSVTAIKAIPEVSAVFTVPLMCH